MSDNQNDHLDGHTANIPLDDIGGDTQMIQPPYAVITWPDGKVEKVVLGRTTIRIGRTETGNQIVVPEELNSISREHCEIRWDGDQAMVVDLESANGVYLNRERVEGSAILEDGDEFTLGLAEKSHQVRIVFFYGTGLVLPSRTHISGLHDPLPSGVILGSSVSEGSPLDVHMTFRWTDGRDVLFPIKDDDILIGRSPEADLSFPKRLQYISNRQCKIQRIQDGFVITDLFSTNGTYLNGRLLEPDAPTTLPDGSVIRIGDDRFGISFGMTFHAPHEKIPAIEGFLPSSERPTREIKTDTFLIGRSPDCDIVLDTPSVSRKHAFIEKIDDVYYIKDLASRNGTFVNNKHIEKTELHNGDLIQIEGHILLYDAGRVTRYDSHGMRLDVVGMSVDVKTRRGPLRILDDVSLTVMPREFIAIVGPSGSGKSTLMNTLTGLRPGDGEVKLNGQDLYDEFEKFRSQIGYVPQSDILHTSLTVEKALNFAAKLRLPGDVSAQERVRRIDKVLDTVEMNTETIRKTRIGKLSGGQRKRISIAAELIADPKLIFLDEATSGLDPGLEKKMMHTLRKMADEGRTVVLITHATANIVQVDHVVFLTRGKLIYFGPPQEALDFFEVDEFADIYERIQELGVVWQETFKNRTDGQYQRYVLDRQESKPHFASREYKRAPKFGFSGFVRQFSVLLQRTINVLASDMLTLGLLLALYPFTALLQLVIASPDVLTGNISILADPVLAAKTMFESYTPIADTTTFVFVTGLEAVLIGMYVPSNELIRERSIYIRERLVNLRIPSYLLSKAAIFTITSAFQCSLYLVVLSFGIDLPEEGLFLPATIEIFITLFLAMIASIGLGLIVSSVSRSSDMAIYILVIFLFIQFFFGGTVFDLRETYAEVFSYLTTTRWALIPLGVTIDIEGMAESTILCNEVPSGPPSPQGIEVSTRCFNYPEARDELLLPYDDENLFLSWGVQIGTAILFIAITGLLIKRLDRT